MNNLLHYKFFWKSEKGNLFQCGHTEGRINKRIPTWWFEEKWPPWAHWQRHYWEVWLCWRGHITKGCNFWMFIYSFISKIFIGRWQRNSSVNILCGSCKEKCHLFLVYIDYYIFFIDWLLYLFYIKESVYTDLKYMAFLHSCVRKSTDRLELL